MFRMYDAQAYRKRKEQQNRSVPALLPQELNEYDLLKLNLTAAYLQQLCLKHPDNNIQKIEFSLKQTPFQEDEPIDATLRIKKPTQTADFHATTRERLDKIYFQLKLQAQTLAFEVICNCIKEEKGSAARLFYQAYCHVSTMSDDQRTSFLAETYGLEPFTSSNMNSSGSDDDDSDSDEIRMTP